MKATAFSVKDDGVVASLYDVGSKRDSSSCTAAIWEAVESADIDDDDETDDNNDDISVQRAPIGVVDEREEDEDAQAIFTTWNISFDHVISPNSFRIIREDVPHLVVDNDEDDIGEAGVSISELE